MGYESCAPAPLQAQNQCKRTYSKQVLKGSANSSILDRSVPANRLSFAKKAPVNSLITMEFVYCQNIIFLYIIRLLINDFILPIWLKFYRHEENHPLKEISKNIGKLNNSDGELLGETVSPRYVNGTVPKIQVSF